MSRSSPPPPRVTRAEFVAGASRAEQLPPPKTLEIAFAGRSNVGKSSLMNALLQRKKLVRTSGTPGCTRQISLFEVTTRLGSHLTLVDLPGYGYAKRSHSERREWAELIHTYLLQRPALAALVALVDIRRGLQPEDEQLLELVGNVPAKSRPPVEILMVATKLDKLSGSERKLAMDQLRQHTSRQWFGFSTELPETHEPLWRALLARLDIDQKPAQAPPSATDGEG
ncbi:MAG TPA: ribosome biogenesis GTP-binding protein YihA/YsxC [Polyangiaceae bacterium]|nr:ribosome biogenesis GTP-binding protein YihA/YsxC [Polyangiaceae bacterium]